MSGRWDSEIELGALDFSNYLKGRGVSSIEGICSMLPSFLDSVFKGKNVMLVKSATSTTCTAVMESGKLQLYIRMLVMRAIHDVFGVDKYVGGYFETPSDSGIFCSKVVIFKSGGTVLQPVYIFNLIGTPNTKGYYEAYNKPLCAKLCKNARESSLKITGVQSFMQFLKMSGTSKRIEFFNLQSGLLITAHLMDYLRYRVSAFARYCDTLGIPTSMSVLDSETQVLLFLNKDMSASYIKYNLCTIGLAKRKYLK